MQRPVVRSRGGVNGSPGSCWEMEMMARVVMIVSTSQKLSAPHIQVVLDGQDLCLHMKMVDGS